MLGVSTGRDMLPNLLLHSELLLVKVAILLGLLSEAVAASTLHLLPTLPDQYLQMSLFTVDLRS